MLNYGLETLVTADGCILLLAVEKEQMLWSLAVKLCSVIFPTLGNRPWHLLHGGTDLASNPSCSKPPSEKKPEGVVTLPGQLCCPAFQDTSWIFSLPYFR